MWLMTGLHLAIHGQAQSNYCGEDYADAIACSNPCPGGLDAERSGATCFAVQNCPPSSPPTGISPVGPSDSSGTPPTSSDTGMSPVSEALPTTGTAPSGPPIDSEGGNYCGDDYAEAISCMQACPGGLDGECNGGRCIKVATCRSGNGPPGGAGTPSSEPAAASPASSSGGEGAPATSGCSLYTAKSAFLAAAFVTVALRW